MTSGNTRGRVTGLVFNPWNLVLILPFIILLTPIYNRKSPEFIGMPFFYWFQFLIIAVGVASTITVYRMTRTVPAGKVLVDDTPADEAPADEAPVDEPPVDKTEEPPADKPPADKPPADKPKDADPDVDDLDEGSVR
jgi:hypothetical protein